MMSLDRLLLHEAPLLSERCSAQQSDHTQCERCLSLQVTKVWEDKWFREWAGRQMGVLLSESMDFGGEANLKFVKLCVCVNC